MTLTIADAILALHPNNAFVLTKGYENIEWVNEPENPSSLAQVNTKLEELQAEYDSQAYARNRKAEYDQLNQFEMQFDDDRDGTTTWVDTINEIKGRHPK